MEDINICLACDKNYIKYALVTITSILENNRENHINFYVIHPVGIEEDYYKKAIETLKNKYLNFDITFVPILDISGYDLRADKTNFFNETLLYRLYIPQLFPQLHRMLYLDSDLIVRRNISEFYKMPLGDYYIAAVIDYDCLKDVLVPEYFNAGVLLMDLDKLREFDFTLKTLTVLKYRYLRFFDQDTINMVLNGKIKSVDRGFNYDIRYHTRYQYKDPTIVHFMASLRRVLRKEETSVFTKEWWKYAKMSPMADQIKEPMMRRSWYY